MRLYSLDGIRGLAAFIVVLNHCFLALPDAVAMKYIVPIIKWTPLRVIMVGRAAVIIFFVLSGLALGLSILHARTQSYRDFVVKRVCRIYPTYIAAILFSALLWHLVQPQPIAELNNWFNKNWADGAGPSVIAGHVLMMNRPQDVSLDSVVWSLAYELRISLIIPLLLALAVFVGTKMFLAITLVLAISTEIWLRYFGIESGAYHNEDWIGAVLTTVHYVPFFCIGLAISTNLKQFTAFFVALPVYASIGLWLVAGATLTQYSDYICASGAVLIIGLVLSSPRISAALDRPVLGWLGRVSYSLYLFHLPLLLTAVHLFHDTIAPAVYMPITILVSFVVAELAYRFIEAPSINWGRTLTLHRTTLAGATPGHETQKRAALF